MYFKFFLRCAHKVSRNHRPWRSCHQCKLLRALSLWPGQNGNGLHKAITDAEKLVGYPTSFNSFKYLFDEEPTNFLALAKKLVGSGHPLLSTARDFLSQDPHIGHHLGGLWILLIAKAAGYKNGTTLEKELVNGIHPKQRALAETTDLINTAFLIHRSIYEPTMLTTIDTKANNLNVLNFGNKLSVLGGDMLHSKASLELGKLGNTEVVELVSKAISDLSGGSILESQKPKHMITLIEWENFVYLLKGSLFANSSEAAVVLSVNDEELRKSAFEFGRNLAYAQQCANDLEEFQNKKKIIHTRNFVAVLAFEKSNFLRQKFMNCTLCNVNSSKELRNNIDEHFPDIVHLVKNTCEERFISKCEDSLMAFHVKSSVDIIKKILKTLIE